MEIRLAASKQCGHFFTLSGPTVVFLYCDLGPRHRLTKTIIACEQAVYDGPTYQGRGSITGKSPIVSGVTKF
jgi:hypothetical protein